MCDRMKIPLGKILCDNGPYAPYGMCDFVYDITLPRSEKIMKAQANEKTGTYRLTDLQLEYDVIKSEGLANSVRGTYNAGRSFPYNFSTLLKTLPWAKGNTREVIDINIPRKSMKAVVLLFTEKDAGDSEHFPFPNLTQVDVTVEGNPNDIYSRGLAKRNMYREAVRFFEKYIGTESSWEICLSMREEKCVGQCVGYVNIAWSFAGLLKSKQRQCRQTFLNAFCYLFCLF